MKKYILSLALCFITLLCASQETYTINGKSFELIKETNGSIELLWNEIDGVYRYFVKKGSTIYELLNLQEENGFYNQEYKDILEDLTSDKSLSAKKVKLTLMSLKTYVDEYNTLKDSSYVVKPKAKLLTRFSIFGGITNSPLISNSDNIKNPVFGVEFEFSEAVELPRHSIYFQGKKTAGSEKFDYSTTQIIVGYRFRIINKKAFNFYTSLDLAQYIFINAKNIELSDTDDIEFTNTKENGLEAPFTFGIGADLKISKKSFLSFTYNELISLLLDNDGNFSTSFAIGYKFQL